MKISIPALYAEYGRYISKFRSIQFNIDCLTPVERRLLLSVHNISKGKLVKSAKIVGNCIGNYHPHGDMCCLPSTRVFSLDGSVSQFGDLADSNTTSLWVLGFNTKTQQQIPVEMRNIRIGQITDISYKVHLSNGGVIECTGNHPILLDNNNWIQTQDLKKYDLVNSCLINNCDRPTIKSYLSTQALLQKLVANQLFGDIEKNIIHHKDFNSKNNHPDNIVQLSRSEHAKLHGDYLIGLEKGRQSMFSDNGKYREETKSRNSALAKELNKNVKYFKIFKIFRMIRKELSIEPTLELYNNYRHHIYNATLIENLIKNREIVSFDDLFRLEKTIKIDTSRIKKTKHNFTKKKQIISNAQKQHILKQAAIIYRHMISSYLKDIDLSYESARKQYILKTGLGNKNINNRSYPKLETLKKYCPVIDDTIDSIPQELSDNGLLTYVAKVEVIKHDTKIKTYDFSVDDHENAYIITNIKDDKLYMTNVHNSTYGSLVQLGRRGLVIKKGNFGHNNGLEAAKPAAMRYTEVKSNSSMNALIADHLKFVPWDSLEGLDSEPLYFSTIVPLGLIGQGFHFGITFYSSIVPRYGYFELCKRLKHLLDNGDVKDNIIVPQVKSTTISENNSNDYLNILQAGKGSLTITPFAKINKNSIDIFGKAPGGGFSTLVKHGYRPSEKKKVKGKDGKIIDKELGNPNGEYYIIDDSKSSTVHIIIEPRRININVLYPKIIKYITKKINILANFVDSSGIINCYGIDNILLKNYNNYIDVSRLKLQSHLNKLIAQKAECEIIAIIRPIIEKYKCYTVSDVINYYNKAPQANITTSDIKSVISKKTIKQLIEQKSDVAAINKKIKMANSDILNIKTIVYDQLKDII